MISEDTIRQKEISDEIDKELLVKDQYSFCAQCGSKVSPIKGSKSAVCENCGFRDSCC